MFSMVAVSIYIPTNGVGGSTPSATFITCRIFDDGHSDRLRGYLIVVLLCLSPISHNEDFFMCLLVICISSLEKYLFKNDIFVVLISINSVSSRTSETKSLLLISITTRTRIY